MVMLTLYHIFMATLTPFVVPVKLTVCLFVQFFFIVPSACGYYSVLAISVNRLGATWRINHMYMHVLFTN